MVNKRYKEAEHVIRKAAKINGKDYETVIKKAAEKKIELQSMVDQKPEVTKRLDDDCNFVDNPDVVQESAKLNQTSINVEVENVEKYNVLTIFKHKILFKFSCILWYAW